MIASEAAAHPVGVVWWLCFLASEDPVYDHISTIGEMLRERGQRLVVIAPDGDFSRCKGFTHFPTPFSLVQQGQRWKDFASPPGLPMTSTAIPEIVDAERLWCGAEPSYETEFLVLRAMAFWEKAFEIMRPAVILAWGTTVPLSRLMLRLAQLTQTPAYAVERGMIANTLMFSLLGQCQISNIGLRLPFIAPHRPDALVEAEWVGLKAFYADTAKADGPTSPRPPSSGPVVAYLGGFDIGSGIAFDNIRAGDRLGGWIKSSVDGARAVARSLSEIAPGATLRIKPHPGTPFILEDQYPGVTIERVQDEDFRDVIRACDACVTPISTTQIFGFLHDKPIVTLANSFFAGREIAYEAVDQASLNAQLGLALTREGWDERLGKAKQLITTLFREEFIGLDPADPCALKIDNLVEHLARFRNYLPHASSPADERIEAFGLFERLARGLRTTWSRADVAAAIGEADWNAIEATLRDDISDRWIGNLIQTLAAAEGPAVPADLPPALAEILTERAAQEARRLDAATSEAETLRGEASRLTKEAETLAAEISRLTADCADKDRERQALERNHSDLAEQLRREAERHESLTEQVSVLEAENSRLVNALSDSEAQGRTLDQHITGLIAQGRHDGERIATLEHDVAAREAENSGLLQALDEKEGQRLDLELQGVVLTGERDAARAAADQNLGRAEAVEQKLATLGDWCRNHFSWSRDRANARPGLFVRPRKPLTAESEAEIDPVDYLTANPDVAASGFDPFLHWELYGREEGRLKRQPPETEGQK